MDLAERPLSYPSSSRRPFPVAPLVGVSNPFESLYDDVFLVEVVPDLPQWICYRGLLRVVNHDRRFRHRHRAALERLVYQERPLVLAVSEGDQHPFPLPEWEREDGIL